MAKGKYHKWLEPDNLIVLEAMARDGARDVDLAKKMGITTTTYYEWVKKYPVISDAIKRGKEVIDAEVENALLKRALGYKYDEQTFESKLDPETNEYVLIPTKTVRKEVVADTTAQIFWLKNRKPKQWRDKQNVEHSSDSISQNIQTLAEVLKNPQPNRQLPDEVNE